jgi:hypothetical protein
VLPPLGLELLFERLVGSDLTTALAYGDSIARYHEQQTFYPWLFRFQGLAANATRRAVRLGDTATRSAKASGPLFLTSAG